MPPTPPNSGIAAVFFDLGDTLGTATIGGQPPRLTGFDVFPFVSGVLTDLESRGLKLGVISNTGSEKGPAVNAVLAPTGLLAQLDNALLVYSGDEGVTKASPEIFNRAAARAGVPAARCLFVGEDAAERMVAMSAGWTVCPHPLLVDEVLDGQSLRYVRLSVPADHAATPWRAELRKRAFVPKHFAGPGGATVYGLTSQRVALELINMRFGVELLGAPDLPQTTDLFLLRDDLARQTGFLASAGEATRVFSAAGAERLILSANADGVVAAVPADVDRGVDAFHFDNARHGHTLKLTPDPLLWDTIAPAPARLAGAALAPPTLAPEAVAEFARIDAATVDRTVARYSGKLRLDGTETGYKVTSRHILAEGNGRAVDQLVADLEAAGQGRFQVRRHPFTHAGVSLQNVEAELAGTSPELVIVSAHMDSTAGSEPGYDPRAHAAPGADDDASGVAGVLAIAERIAALAGAAPPARTIRFVLFNAEEQGLIGSKAYARRSKARAEVIAAVWQMDMIGYNQTPPRTWELHAGFQESADVEARSVALAELLAALAPQTAPALPAPQIHHSAGPVGDPAAGRSDHASFQAHGYPACLASEDFFIDAPDAPDPDANPNYHRTADTVIDPAYAADLARAVAAAVWVSANA
ncbi:MAG TPA: M20/M25/M40 family metallo-hydrolase [Gemmataceae bacterium]|nr:M20/M25/M40 family metallo-hydrolase [Gemmataceae bacterium]